MQSSKQSPSQPNELDLQGPYGLLEFAQAQPHVGMAMRLARSRALVLERYWPTGASEAEARGLDAVGAYPFLTFQRFDAMASELLLMQSEWVSFTAVVDPLAGVSEAALKESFVDRVVRFKDHFVLDLENPVLESISKHHKREARRGQKRVTVEWAEDQTLAAGPGGQAWQSDWLALYAQLAARHSIQGPAAFDAQSLRSQMALPGVRVQRACIAGRTVSMALWYPRGAGVTYHLAATSPEGYEASAAYALLLDAFERFREEGLAWVHLGAGAGVTADANSGLNAFKSGWATRSVPAYLCGRILQPERYAQWCGLAGVTPEANFFPAYRAPQPGSESHG